MLFIMEYWCRQCSTLW